jgi:ABC-type lipoprotein export system ATPase subunit
MKPFMLLVILIVTHDQEFASNCDRIIEMEDGKVISA